MNVFDAATVTRWASVREDERVGWRVDTVQGSKEKLLDKTNIDEEEKAWKNDGRENESVWINEIITIYNNPNDMTDVLSINFFHEYIVKNLSVMSVDIVPRFLSVE